MKLNEKIGIALGIISVLLVISGVITDMFIRDFTLGFKLYISGLCAVGLAICFLPPPVYMFNKRNKVLR